MFNNIMTLEFINENISIKLVDKYKGTPFEGYSFLTNGNKGTFGESFTSKYLTLLGHNVSSRTNTGHDRTVNGIKTEIKFSLADYDKSFNCVLNHISKDKDWDRLIYTIINSNESDFKMIWFTKKSFIEMINTTDIFSHQQGGKSVNNDDYMVSGQRKILELINHPLVKDISEW